MSFSFDEAAGELIRVINSVPISTPAQVRKHQRASAERALRAAYEAGKREARGTREARSVRPTASPSQPAITTRQREALDIIVDYFVEHGRPPTLREIGERMGIGSTNAVNDHLKALARKGYIDRDPMVNRGIRLRSAPTPSPADAMLVGVGTIRPLRDVLTALADAAMQRMTEYEPPLNSGAAWDLRAMVRAARAYASGQAPEPELRNDQPSDGVGPA